MDENESEANFSDETERDYVLIGSDGEEIVESSGNAEASDPNCGQLCRTLSEIGISCPGHSSSERTFPNIPVITDTVAYTEPNSSNLPVDYSNVEDLLITLKIKIAAMKKDAQAKDELIAQQVSLLELQTQVLRNLHAFRISK